mmetsp:Transcript_7113/g.10671  ORF Transcript_7113/g.10671 Transcript_7113/m.10671 type:complete len:230 (-) Transcript_7113:1286-1975(-)
MSMLLEMLSRWPRYLSQGPAMLMWSVVHFPCALISTGQSAASSAPSHPSNGSSRARRALSGLTTTSSPVPSSGGAWKVSSPGSNPRGGSSFPWGASNLNSPPPGVGMESLSGSKVMVPAKAQAVTSSGEVTKAWVWGLPSLRLAKLRLYEVRMELASPCFSCLFHWPMQGPQALASTVPPAFSKVSTRPSRAMVARTCSDPGVMRKGALQVSPAAMAWATRSAQRVMSS